MAAAIHSQEIEAELTVRVAHGAPGDLATGVHNQIERVDGVRVDELNITGITPGLNDTSVATTATLAVDLAGDSGAGDDIESGGLSAEQVRSRLTSCFGIEPVQVTVIDPG